MFAIRARRKVATERDFLDAVEKVVRQGTKFSSTYVLSRCELEHTTNSEVFQAIVSGVQLAYFRTYAYTFLLSLTFSCVRHEFATVPIIQRKNGKIVVCGVHVIVLHDVTFQS